MSPTQIDLKIKCEFELIMCYIEELFGKLYKIQ